MEIGTVRHGISIDPAASCLPRKHSLCDPMNVRDSAQPSSVSDISIPGSLVDDDSNDFCVARPCICDKENDTEDYFDKLRMPPPQEYYLVGTEEFDQAVASGLLKVSLWETDGNETTVRVVSPPDKPDPTLGDPYHSRDSPSTKLTSPLAHNETISRASTYQERDFQQQLVSSALHQEVVPQVFYQSESHQTFAKMSNQENGAETTGSTGKFLLPRPHRSDAKKGRGARPSDDVNEPQNETWTDGKQTSNVQSVYGSSRRNRKRKILTTLSVSSRDKPHTEDGTSHKHGSDHTASSSAALSSSEVVVESTKFQDIIGHGAIKVRMEEILLSVSLPGPIVRTVLTGIRSQPTSVMLHGPPGCGKVRTVMHSRTLFSFRSANPITMIDRQNSPVPLPVKLKQPSFLSHLATFLASLLENPRHPFVTSLQKLGTQPPKSRLSVPSCSWMKLMPWVQLEEDLSMPAEKEQLEMAALDVY